jgi:hypothetical protein
MGVAIGLGAVMAGTAIMGSIMGGQQQVAQQHAARRQHEEQEFQRSMDNQIQNRRVARANAAKWLNNEKIGEAANETRAEQEFWMRYNFENANGDFSRQFNNINNKITHTLLTKKGNLSGGTAQAILRQSLNQAKKGHLNRSVNYENAMISSERKHTANLNKRDFGYADQVKFIPGQLHQVSDSSIMSSALTAGIIQGIGAGAGGFAMGMKYNAAKADAGGWAKLAGDGGGGWGDMTVSVPNVNV